MYLVDLVQSVCALGALRIETNENVFPRKLLAMRRTARATLTPAAVPQIISVFPEYFLWWSYHLFRFLKQFFDFEPTIPLAELLQ